MPAAKTHTAPTRPAGPTTPGAVGPASARAGVGVFVGSYLPYSETFIHDQLRSHRRYRPEVFCYARVPAAERFPFEPVHALSGPARWLYWTLGRSRRFDQVLDRGEIALLHAHFGTNGVYAAPFARAHRMPLVVTFHGHDVPALIGRSRYTLRYGRYAALAGPMLARAALLLPASRDLADKLIGQIGADPAKVEVLPLGIDTARFSPAADRDPRPTVLMVGRFVAKKGHIDGLHAFAQALGQVPDARLVLIGDGPLRPDYERVIADLGIAPAVELTGVLAADQVAAHMQRAHVLLCPSVTAPNGDVESGVIVVKEAGATARPVIGTHHGGIPEIIVHEHTGFLVAEHAVTAMAGHLVELLRDPALSARMGAAARAHVEAHFDLATQVGALEALYDRALGS
ncbi:glycosyltransferase [Haliangium sp.]|uniref:glycosyltransferase n=1 Tax=Haliangium sp. TaxID=2663208 RepID=UPI003D0C90CA